MNIISYSVTCSGKNKKEKKEKVKEKLIKIVYKRRELVCYENAGAKIKNNK